MKGNEDIETVYVDLFQKVLLIERITHFCSPSTWGGWDRKTFFLRPAWATQQILGHLDKNLVSETGRTVGKLGAPSPLSFLMKWDKNICE